MESQSARPTVLLAEDHADTRAYYSELFRSSALNVIETGRGDLALQMAREQRPSLIVTDLSLPGITGLELARALKENPETAGIPILCLSGYADSDTSDAAAASGIDRMLTKPCMPDELLANVREMLSLSES